MYVYVATDLISRDGTVSKDARLKNCFVDGGDVFKRPAVESALATAAGQAQGGIANNSLVFTINGDTMHSYNSSFVLQQTIAL